MVQSAIQLLHSRQDLGFRNCMRRSSEGAERCPSRTQTPLDLYSSQIRNRRQMMRHFTKVCHLGFRVARVTGLSPGKQSLYMESWLPGVFEIITLTLRQAPHGSFRPFRSSLSTNARKWWCHKRPMVHSALSSRACPPCS